MAAGGDQRQVFAVVHPHDQRGEELYRRQRRQTQQHGDAQSVAQRFAGAFRAAGAGGVAEQGLQAHRQPVHHQGEQRFAVAGGGVGRHAEVRAPAQQLEVVGEHQQGQVELHQQAGQAQRQDGAATAPIQPPVRQPQAQPRVAGEKIA